MALDESTRVHNTALKIIKLAESLKSRGCDITTTTLPITVNELRSMALAITELGDENVKLKLKLMENGVNYAD